ncbi:MAG: nuclear transport factor 2 family protein [Actinomycetota bacterium]|nr:nuclear transport factor 2 family protein [Actinomycetota bacterium]
MNQADEVLRLAEVRASALVEGEPDRLRRLLHPEFQWTSHRGERYDRESYVLANTRGLRWLKQRLEDPEVTVVGDTAILLCTVSDTVLRDGQEADLRMPVTQVWVRAHKTWVMLAGHAGPMLD